MSYYPIDEDAARRAKNANSFYDYREGSATESYRQMVDDAIEIAERQKKRVDPMYHEKIDSLLETYCRRLAANLNQAYIIDASCPSILIAGGSNFPVRKKEKQNARRQSNIQEYNEIQGILAKIKGVGCGGISSDDPQAIKKLETKLESLQNLQEQMKAVNAYYRKYKTLEGCPDLPPDQIEKLKADMKSSWHIEDKPFPSYCLSNNNAEIRRLNGRIADLKKRETDAPPEGWNFDGGEVVVNTGENRLQIIFEEKPDADLRAELKGNGFRWAPSQGAWQRQLNENAIRAAKRIKAICPEE